MYLNCKYVIGRESLSVKNPMIGFNPSSDCAFDLFKEFDRVRISVFFMTFSLIVVMIGEVELLGEFGGFENDESKIGLLCIVSFGVKSNISSKILVIGEGVCGCQ